MLLVDGGSASGSEVMAAALRDHGRAVIIGEQTLGKGTVNLPRRLSDGSVLYVSIARWLTPAGELIEGIGVIPDIIVEPTDEDFEQRRDVALYAAIDYLRGEVTPAPSPDGGLGERPVADDDDTAEEEEPEAEDGEAPGRGGAVGGGIAPVATGAARLRATAERGRPMPIARQAKVGPSILDRLMRRQPRRKRDRGDPRPADRRGARPGR